MSQDEMDREMADMRKSRPAVKPGQPKTVDNKAEAARKARMSKRADVPRGTASATSEKLTTEAAAPAEAVLAEHTVASGDNLSHIAQKYYNSAARDKWMAIYEANKETIGDNPSLIRVGQVLKIPTLSD